MGGLKRRALTSLELMIAMTITALIGIGVAGMLQTATMGMSGRRDNREAIVRAAVAEARISAYVTPARFLLDAIGTTLVIWFDPSSESRFVAASELRWVFYDAGAKTLEVHYVELPPGITELQKSLYEAPTLIGADWMDVYSNCAAQGLITKRTLLDHVAEVNLIMTNNVDVEYVLKFETSVGETEMTIEASVRNPVPLL